MSIGSNNMSMKEYYRRIYEKEILELKKKNSELENDNVELKIQNNFYKNQKDKHSASSELEEVNRILLIQVEDLQKELNEKKKRKKVKEVNIENFKHLLSDIPDKAKKESFRGAPEQVSQLQNMWLRIPDEMKKGELQKLWDRKFSEWDKVINNRDQKRKDNEFYNGLDHVAEEADKLLAMREELVSKHLKKSRR